MDVVYLILSAPYCPPVLGDLWKVGDTPIPLSKGLCPSELPIAK